MGRYRCDTLPVLFQFDSDCVSKTPVVKDLDFKETVCSLASHKMLFDPFGFNGTVFKNNSSAETTI